MSEGALLLAAVVPPVPAEGGWDSLFSVDFGLAFWNVLTFLTLLGVLAAFAWKPILGALDAREKRIQDNIDEARKQRDEASALLTQHREQLAEARVQAQGLIAEGRAAAETVRKELEAKAREESRVMLENARREIERERKAAVASVRRESVDVALAVASRLLGENLDADRDRRLAMSYIDDLADDAGTPDDAEARGRTGARA